MATQGFQNVMRRPSPKSRSSLLSKPLLLFQVPPQWSGAGAMFSDGLHPHFSQTVGVLVVPHWYPYFRKPPYEFCRWFTSRNLFFQQTYEFFQFSHPNLSMVRSWLDQRTKKNQLNLPGLGQEAEWRPLLPPISPDVAEPSAVPLNEGCWELLNGSQYPVGGFKPSEKYQSIGMIIPNIWENKCSKPPTRNGSWYSKLQKDREVNHHFLGLESLLFCQGLDYSNCIHLHTQRYLMLFDSRGRVKDKVMNNNHILKAE